MDKIWTGTLRKMRVEEADPVRYFLTDGWFEPEKRVDDHRVNDYLGRELFIDFTGRINCTACGRKTKKTFNQGFCFPCAQSRAEADICIVKPELCHHGQADNPCRDEAFAQAQCFQPHVLYCSLTSGVKVGITRAPNIPSRWIDQGADAAMPLAVLPDRRSVGLVEKRLSDEGFQDKTHWTRMLKGEANDTNLAEVADKVLARLEAWEIDGILPAVDRGERRFTYPVQTWPIKVKSFNLDKDPRAGGLLQGIRGQYLIFEDGVINLRKYSGYQVDVSA